MTIGSTAIVSAAEAAAVVRSGDTVFLASGAATPAPLVRALHARAASLSDVTLMHFITNGALPPDDGSGDATDRNPFVHRAFFIGTEMRTLIDRGDPVEYVPLSVAQVPRLVAAGRLHVDVAFLQTTRLDASGGACLGVGVDIATSMARSARVVVAEMNARMPFALGDTGMAAGTIHFGVETDRALPEFVHAQADDLTRQVARYIADLIEDGSTLQVGVGQIPNEVLRFLADRQHLGIHSDLITDSVLDLIDRGVVDGSAKTTHRGLVVASYGVGTRRLYDRIDRNPMFAFQAIDRIVDPAVIAGQHRMVSITQAFSIDLTGQACADQFDGQLYGGVSTQPDFMRAVGQAPKGKAILCLASTTLDRSVSRIRPMLPAGEGVTVARADVHYVVTEFGIANLFGKSIRERALALIEIAHPDFRDGLLDEAKRLGYLPSRQRIASHVAYPVEEVRTLSLRGGAHVRVRPARASDADAIRALFHRMSEDDIYTRFFRRLSCLSFDDAQRLCDVDYANEVTFVATEASADDAADDDRIVATASYYRDRSASGAEVAYMILPAWQGRGLGRALQSLLFAYGKRHGIERFVAEILRSNAAMVALARKACERVEVELEDDTYVVVMRP